MRLLSFVFSVGCVGANTGLGVDIDSTEQCANGLDDDGDGQTDCLDADCRDKPACGGPGEDTSADRPPVARITASPAQPVSGDLVTLDGRESDDPDGDTITTYAWTLERMPNGSGTSITNANEAVATLLVDLLGPYEIRLTVTSNEQVASVTRTLNTGADNEAPTAHAGSDANGAVDQAVTLGGVCSGDPENDPLTYSWTWVRQVGSADFDDASLRDPTFVPDAAGCWVAQLQVSDGELNSLADRVCVSVYGSGVGACTLVDCGEEPECDR